MLCYEVISWQSKPMPPISIGGIIQASWWILTGLTEVSPLQLFTRHTTDIGRSAVHTQLIALACPDAMDVRHSQYNGFLHDQPVFASQRMVMLNFHIVHFQALGKFEE